MAGTYPWPVLAPVAGLAADFLCHVLAAWLGGERRPFLCILAGVAGGLLVMAALSVWALAGMGVAMADWLAFLAFNGVTYLALAYGYYNFVQLNITSLRIRILQELLAAEHSLRVDELLEQYGARELVEKRIARLTAGNLIVLKDGRFYGRSSPLLLVARGIHFMKLVVLGKRPRYLAAAGPSSRFDGAPQGERPGVPHHPQEQTPAHQP